MSDKGKKLAGRLAGVFFSVMLMIQLLPAASSAQTTSELDQGSSAVSAAVTVDDDEGGVQRGSTAGDVANDAMNVVSNDAMNVVSNDATVETAIGAVSENSEGTWALENPTSVTTVAGTDSINITPDAYVTCSANGILSSTDTSVCSASGSTLRVKAGKAVAIDSNALEHASDIMVVNSPANVYDFSAVSTSLTTCIECDGEQASLPDIGVWGVESSSIGSGEGALVVFYLPNAKTVTIHEGQAGRIVAPNAMVKTVSSAASGEASGTASGAAAGANSSSASDAAGTGTIGNAAQKAVPLVEQKSSVSILDVEATGSDVSGSVHLSASLNKESYSQDETASMTVKYTIEPGAASEGDYFTISLPKEVASNVRISADPQHFSGVVDNGDGTYKIVFGPGAKSAITGSFKIYFTAKSSGTVVDVPVTVIPSGSAPGTGTYTDAIMKDAADNQDANGNDKVGYGGYDTSEGYGDNAAQIGVYDSTNDTVLKYRLYVNDKKASLNNVTVVDTLPDGMAFDKTKGVEVVDRETGNAIDPSLYTVSEEGNKLTFAYPGSFNNAIEIDYWVNVKGGKNVKYTNRAEIKYDSNGTTYQEHRNYVLQGNDYSAASGEKSVDKTVITSDPDDQYVTYTLKFWNSSGFDAGAINLNDVLDSHVKFLYADDNDYFGITYDEATNTVHVTNTKAISGSDTEYVRFTVDFSDVPEGYTVENTVGGNTTKTLKMPSVDFSAAKTVNGNTPADDQTYTFELQDSDGNPIQDVENDGSSVTFDKIYYTEDDLNADGSDSTIQYTVHEMAGDDPLTTYDQTVYNIAVTLHRYTDANGKQWVSATPVITSGGATVDFIAFNNTVASAAVVLPATGADGLGLLAGVGIAVVAISAYAVVRHSRREGDAVESMNAETPSGSSPEGDDRDE